MRTLTERITAKFITCEKSIKRMFIQKKKTIISLKKGNKEVSQDSPGIYLIMPFVANLDEMNSIGPGSKIKKNSEDVKHFVLIIIDVRMKSVYLCDSGNFRIIKEVMFDIFQSWLYSNVVDEMFEKYFDPELMDSQWTFSTFKGVKQTEPRCAEYVHWIAEKFMIDGISVDKIFDHPDFNDKFMRTIQRKKILENLK